MKTEKRRVAAFTLIELLVVVAIIAVLLSILLPSLSRAREQAKIAVCISNLRSITLAGNQYILEFENLPWALPRPYQTPEGDVDWSVYTEFIWGGGWPPKWRPSDWQATGIGARLSPVNADINLLNPKYRPMNPYFSPEVSWSRGAAQQQNPPRAEIPGFFTCPSDSSAAVPEANQSDNDDLDSLTPFRTVDYWGTSYPINWYWPYYYVGRGGFSGPLTGDVDFLTALGANSGQRGLGTRMLRAASNSTWAADFILFYENRLNYALEGALPRGASNPNAKNIVGWHKDMNMHAAGFIDGHAQYRSYDTRFVDGPGWTSWPAKPWEGGWAQFNDD